MRVRSNRSLKLNRKNGMASEEGSKRATAPRKTRSHGTHVCIRGWGEHARDGSKTHFELRFLTGRFFLRCPVCFKKTGQFESGSLLPISHLPEVYKSCGVRSPRDYYTPAHCYFASYIEVLDL